MTQVSKPKSRTILLSALSCSALVATAFSQGAQALLPQKGDWTFAGYSHYTSSKPSGYGANCDKENFSYENTYDSATITLGGQDYLVTFGPGDVVVTGETAFASALGSHDSLADCNGLSSPGRGGDAFTDFTTGGAAGSINTVSAYQRAPDDALVHGNPLDPFNPVDPLRPGAGTGAARVSNPAQRGSVVCDYSTGGPDTYSVAGTMMQFHLHGTCTLTPSGGGSPVTEHKHVLISGHVDAVTALPTGGPQPPAYDSATVHSGCYTYIDDANSDASDSDHPLGLSPIPGGCDANL